MPDRAVVPEGHRTGRPRKPRGEPLIPAMLEQIGQQRHGLARLPALDADCEGRVYIERLATALRVDEHHRVDIFADQPVGLGNGHGLALLRRVPLGGVFPRRGMDGVQSLERTPQARRQGLERRRLAGEQGVAAELGCFHGIEDRADGGPFQKTHVGVPAAAEVDPVLRLLDHLHHRRMLGHASDVRMDIQRTEPRAERRLALRRQRLVTKEDHLMIDQRPADCRDGCVRQILAQINAGELRAERAGGATDLQRRDHGGRLLARLGFMLQ